MNVDNYFIQISKRLIIGIVCFLIIFILTFALDERLGLISLCAFILVILYPIFIDRILDKFFYDKLQKYNFLKRLHFTLLFIVTFSMLGIISKNEKFKPELLPFYLLVLALVFTFKKRRFLKNK